MARICKTPHEGGASRDDLPVRIRNLLTAFTIQTPALVVRYGVRPVIAATPAAVVFGEGHNHG